MQNGIIINGVKYEAVETTARDGCDGCAFEGMIGGCLMHNPCFAFHPLDVIFVKFKDRTAITKEEAAKRIAEYATRNLDKFAHGDTKEVMAEINKLL